MGGWSVNRMWQPLKNFVNSLQTYDVLSPDLQVRKQVNRWLKGRICLNPDDWFISHWAPPARPQAYSKPLIQFTYHHLEQYSGLAIGCTEPQDRLLEDLQFPMVCWFDWGITLCEDFQASFGIDISDRFDETQFDTLADLVDFLSRQLKKHGSA